MFDVTKAKAYSKMVIKLKRDQIERIRNFYHGSY